MKTRIIGAVVAVIIAAVGAFLLISYVRGADARAAEGAELTEVYIVQETIPRGTAGETVKDFVKLDTLPERNVAADNVTNLDDLAGLVSDADILSGEQLQSARFVNPLELAAQGDVPVPEGMQEVTITLPVNRVVGGKVTAGSEVGMVTTFERPGLADPPQTQFAFHDVLVTNVQRGTSATADNAGEPETAQQLMVTVALTTHQVERWVWAAEGYERGVDVGVWLTLENAATDNGGSSPVSGSTFYE
ncbi:hypothetical protein ASE14_14090 [Agromyces sp. Root81]|uniref:Flp pilus assembly protein CpaB n=1 Tax=Agromyces sp. Root81 TaxID=1736601 RepID=UPI0006F447DE|nr:RcpC/CpaB family pilus assembly protein [Agromyces sp. Root81]KRC61910.1 hypothetical protein ASE14_14090 [Agromyces sp. Root81]